MLWRNLTYSSSIWGKSQQSKVRRIKTVNIRDLAVGLYMAWGRLDEVYGSLEAIKQALFSKLENFPKVTTKDPQRLRDLTDLLSKLQAAKEAGYLAGLSCLDISRGIRPIIEKLPYNLLWLYYGTKYKQEHFITFPSVGKLHLYRGKGLLGSKLQLLHSSSNFFTQAPAERKGK